MSENNKKHVHYDLIVKWAEEPDKYIVEYFADYNDCWIKADDPGWYSNAKYRLRPKSPSRKYKWVLKDSNDSLFVSYAYYSSAEHVAEVSSATPVQRIDTEYIEE